MVDTRMSGRPARSSPSFLATPSVIAKANVAPPVTDGYVTAAAVCSTPALTKLCTTDGITNAG